jgi:hypothetical protein
VELRRIELLTSSMPFLGGAAVECGGEKLLFRGMTRLLQTAVQQ